MDKDQQKELIKEVEAAARRGARNGGLFARIRSLIIGIVIGVLLLSAVSAHLHHLKFIDAVHSLFSREESVENHDLTLENHGIFGYTAADFEEAILGKDEELRKLEVYSVEVSDVGTITNAGLFDIKAFSKYQFVTYHGTAVYTVDLSKLRRGCVDIDNDSRTVTLTVPDVELNPITIPSENIEFGQVEKNTVLAIGKIKVTPEDMARVQTEAVDKIESKLAESNTADDARLAAEHSIWSIFQPVVTELAPGYSMQVVFDTAGQGNDDTAEDDATVSDDAESEAAEDGGEE